MVLLYFWSPWYGFVCPSMFLISSRKRREPRISSEQREGPHPAQEVPPLTAQHHHQVQLSWVQLWPSHTNRTLFTGTQNTLSFPSHRTPHCPQICKIPPSQPPLCGHHNNVPGSSVPSRSILSKLELIEPQLKQSSTNYNKPPLQFPINLTTTLQQTSGFPQSPCASTPGKIPQHGSSQAFSGHGRGDKQNESKAKMPSRLEANNLFWPLAAPTHY